MLDSLELELQVVVEKGLNHRAIFLAWSTVIFFFYWDYFVWYCMVRAYHSLLL